MSYETLRRPNDFMLGYKPFSNVIYDESITPLEMLNKLAYKLNEIVASDTNVKDNVDKLLGVWKEAFMAKAGYAEPIETVFSENTIQAKIHVLIDDIEVEKVNNVYEIDSNYRYKPIRIYIEFNEVVEVNIYKNDNFLSKTTGLQTLDTFFFLPSKSESIKIKVAAQNKNYTHYAYLHFKVVESEMKAQEKTVTPDYVAQKVVPDTPTYNCLSKVTVNPCPFSETSNENGTTINM